MEYLIVFLVGVAFGLIFYFSSLVKRRELSREIRSLKESLQVQMSINAEGNRAMTKLNADLTEKNKNLEISLAALKSRPEKAEIQKLMVYDKAIHLMYERAPGFAPAWESVLKEAESEMAKSNNGLIAWTRKIIRPSLSRGGDASKQ